MAEQYATPAPSNPPSKMGLFYKKVEIPLSKASVLDRFGRLRKLFLRSQYFLARKFVKASDPISYAGALASLLIQCCKGDYTEQLDHNILAPTDFIRLTDSMRLLIERLDREERVRDIIAFDQLTSYTIRSLCIHEDDGEKKYADPSEHIYAHAVAIYGIVALLKQPKSFFVGANDEINVRMMTNGLKNLTIYMESVLSIRL